MLWDAYLFYGPEATWEEAPTPLIDYGATIYRQRAALDTLLRPYLDGTGGR